MSIKPLPGILVLAVFGFELFRRQRVGAGRLLIAGAAVLSYYELLHKENFGTIQSLIFLGLSFYAWRNWFVSLCALILFMAFIDNRDTPHAIAGIQGLNYWNFGMLNILLSWWRGRRRDGISWDMPAHVVVLWAACMFVVVWSYLRIAGDYEVLNNIDLEGAGPRRFTLSWITSEYLINCVKWVLPGILLYDGCRSRERTTVALGMIFILYLLLALQVVKCMPLSAATADGRTLSRISARVLDPVVGYFRTELSMMLAGASWAILSAVAIVSRRRFQLVILVAAAYVALGQALTGGRTGYATWGLTGLVLCALRWRKLLPLVPCVILCICLFLPGVRGRMLSGMGSEQSNIKTSFSLDDVTSGRNIAWSYEIDYIERSPLIGYGRQAMLRAGIYQKINEDFGEDMSFGQPHNAYLELLLDNGVVGFVLALPLYFVLLAHSFSLLKDRSDPLFSAVGGAAAALLLGLMIAGIGSQSFYPQESAVGMWAAVGLMLRVYVERRQSWTTGEPLFGEQEQEIESEQAVDESQLPIPVPA